MMIKIIIEVLLKKHEVLINKQTNDFEKIHFYIFLQT